MDVRAWWRRGLSSSLRPSAWAWLLFATLAAIRPLASLDDFSVAVRVLVVLRLILGGVLVIVTLRSGGATLARAYLTLVIAFFVLSPGSDSGSGLAALVALGLSLLPVGVRRSRQTNIDPERIYAPPT